MPPVQWSGQFGRIRARAQMLAPRAEKRGILNVLLGNDLRNTSRRPGCGSSAIARLAQRMQCGLSYLAPMSRAKQPSIDRSSPEVLKCSLIRFRLNCPTGILPSLGRLMGGWSGSIFCPARMGTASSCPSPSELGNGPPDPGDKTDSVRTFCRQLPATPWPRARQIASSAWPLRCAPIPSS